MQSNPVLRTLVDADLNDVSELYGRLATAYEQLLREYKAHKDCTDIDLGNAQKEIERLNKALLSVPLKSEYNELKEKNDRLSFTVSEAIRERNEAEEGKKYAEQLYSQYAKDWQKITERLQDTERELNIANEKIRALQTENLKELEKDIIKEQKKLGVRIDFLEWRLTSLQRREKTRAKELEEQVDREKERADRNYEEYELCNKERMANDRRIEELEREGDGTFMYNENIQLLVENRKLKAALDKASENAKNMDREIKDLHVTLAMYKDELQ